MLRAPRSLLVYGKNSPALGAPGLGCTDKLQIQAGQAALPRDTVRETAAVLRDPVAGEACISPRKNYKAKQTKKSSEWLWHQPPFCNHPFPTETFPA